MRILITAVFLLLPNPTMVGPLVFKACETKDRANTDLVARKAKTKQEAFTCIVWNCKNPEMYIYIETNPASVPLYWESSRSDYCE